jgi:Flp pilus assembly CpaE family ATPase
MSSEPPRVVLALTPLAERAIEPWLFGEQAAVTPIASIAEADEVDRSITAAGADALLISPGLSGLTSAHLERVRAHGLRLVGIALDAHERDELTKLGVDAVVSADASVDTLLNATDDDQPPAVTPRNEARSSNESDEPRGTVLAVIGTKGAPGTSECAASLAALAGDRWPTLLIELDLLGGGIDVRIGASARTGSVVGLVRAAQSDAAPLGELIERWVVTASGWPPVLLGPSDPDKALDELARPGALATTLRALRASMPLTICDVGSLLGSGDDLARLARVHREALVTADTVLLIMGARDEHLRVGLAQLGRLLDTLGISAERLRIVVNGIDGPGAAGERQLNATLVPRLAERGLSADAWLAWDQRALDRARRKGLPLAAARRRGRYARVLEHLLDELFLPTAPAARRRKRRLTAPVTSPTARQCEGEEVAIPWRT